MAHWAKINENSVVVDVTVGNNDEPDEGYQWLVENLGGVWVKTSYNTSRGVYYIDGVPSEDQTKAFRKNYAGIGYTYDEVRDAFIPPKPFNSWILNEESCIWEAPTPHPEDGQSYYWDESQVSWVAGPPPIL